MNLCFVYTYFAVQQSQKKKITTPKKGDRENEQDIHI